MLLTQPFQPVGAGAAKRVILDSLPANLNVIIVHRHRPDGIVSAFAYGLETIRSVTAEVAGDELRVMCSAKELPAGQALRLEVPNNTLIEEVSTFAKITICDGGELVPVV